MNAVVTARGHEATASRLYEDPWLRVWKLDARTSSLGAWFGFGAGGAALLGAFVGVALAVTWLHVRPALMGTTQEIEVAKFDVPAAPPSTARPEPKEATAAAAHPTPRDSPPSSPTRAGRTLTAEGKAGGPDDLVEIAQGDAETYAGAFTTPSGTGSAALAAPGVAEGPLAHASRVAPPPAVVMDASRAASLSGASEWTCPFPAEADVAQVDEASVTLEVDVNADGTTRAVRVLRDPGNGFAREARRCAMAKQYTTALDPAGAPIAGTTKPFRVHFTR